MSSMTREKNSGKHPAEWRQRVAALARENRALRHSFRNYRQLFADSPLPMFVYDRESLAILAANNAAVRQYGFAQGEFRSLTVKDLMPTEDVGRLLTNVAQAHDVFQKSGLWRQRRRDGRVFPAQITSHALVFEGRTARLVFAEDVSEQATAEAKLRESERFIQSVAEASPHCVYVFDFDRMDISYANRPIISLLGYGPEVVAGVGGLEAFQAFMPPEELPHLARVMEEWQALPDGRVRDDEYCLCHASGSLHYFAGREIVFARRPDGSVQRILGLLFDATERKEAEHALRKSEERLRQGIRVVGLGLFEHDHLTEAIFFSPENRAIWGWNETEPITMAGIVERVHPADVENYLRLVKRAHDPAGEGLFAIEHRVVRPDGTMRWVSTRAQTSFEGEGAGRRAARTVGALVDITESKEGEQALRQSQADMDHAQAVGQLGSWRLDIRRNVLTWSNEIYRIFGVPQGAALTYERFLEFVHPEDREHVDGQWNAALAGAPYDIEHRIVVDGRVKWVREKAYLEHDAEGKLLGGFGIAQDITERKQAEEKLAASERRFRAMTEKAVEDIILLNAEGRILYESPHEVSLLGFEPGELTGHNGFQLVHPDDLWIAHEKLATVLRVPGAAARGELRMRRKDGGWSWIHFYATNLLHEPAVSAVVVNLHDISERRQVEEELRSRSERLALLSDAADALLSATDPIQFLDGIYARLSNLLGLEVCVHYELKAGETHLDLVLSRGLPEHVAARIRRLELGQAVCGSVAATGQRLVVSDAQHSTDERSAFVRSLGISAFACHPLVAKGQLVGTLAFGTRQRPQIDTESLALIQTVCNQVATALERRQAEEALRQARDELERRVEERTAELGHINERLVAEIAGHEKAQIALQSQATFLDMASDAILAWNLNGPIVYWNQGAERLYGFSRREALGRVNHELLATQHVQGLDAILKPLLKHGEWTGELIHRTKQGTTLIVESRMKILDQPNGQRLVIESNRDLTERLKLQGEIVAASERERERFGHDLHDGLCQILTGARLKTESLADHVAAHAPESAQRARAVVGLIAQALEESRNLARGLEPVSNDPEGLRAALHQLAESTSRLFGVNCTCTAAEPAAVQDHSAATELFRITQEAVSNAIKHGHATTISLYLASGPEGVVLKVTNDGKPFPKQPRNLGMGLKTMRFRAGRIGATLTLQAGHHGGTIVRCALPPAPLGALRMGPRQAPAGPHRGMMSGSPTLPGTGGHDSHAKGPHL
jgi:PAS domain S-box-containing protein